MARRTLSQLSQSTNSSPSGNDEEYQQSNEIRSTKEDPGDNKSQESPSNDRSTSSNPNIASPAPSQYPRHKLRDQSSDGYADK